MGSWSDYVENKILDHVLGATVFTAPATVYIALFTTAPSDSGGGVEVSGNGYQRVAVANNTTNWPAASGGQKSNGQAITFPVATGSWGTVVAAGVFDAASGGNLLVWSLLGTAKAISAGQAPQFPAGAIVVTQD